MRKMHKFRFLQVAGVVEARVEVDVNAMFIPKCFGIDREGHVCMWAEVDPFMEMKKVVFRIIYTGSDVPGGFSYVGTAIEQDGTVGHIYMER